MGLGGGINYLDKGLLGVKVLFIWKCKIFKKFYLLTMNV